VERNAAQANTINQSIMKINNLLLIVFCFAFAMSCGKKAETDSAEIAEEQK
jgi:hypothetical protein